MLPSQGGVRPAHPHTGASGQGEEVSVSYLERPWGMDPCWGPHRVCRAVELSLPTSPLEEGPRVQAWCPGLPGDHTALPAQPLQVAPAALPFVQFRLRLTCPATCLVPVSIRGPVSSISPCPSVFCPLSLSAFPHCSPWSPSSPLPLHPPSPHLC